MRKTIAAFAVATAMTTLPAWAEGPDATMTEDQIATEIVSTQSAEGSAPGIVIPLLLLVIVAASMSSGSL